MKAVKMMQLVRNLLGTKPTDNWGRATLNRCGVLTELVLYTNGLYFLDDLLACGLTIRASLVAAPIHLRVGNGVFVG